MLFELLTPFNRFWRGGRGFDFKGGATRKLKVKFEIIFKIQSIFKKNNEKIQKYLKSFRKIQKRKKLKFVEFFQKV